MSLGGTLHELVDGLRTRILDLEDKLTAAGDEIKELEAQKADLEKENARLRQALAIAPTVDLDGDPFDGGVLDDIPAGAALKLAHLIADPSPIREARNLFTATGTQN